MFNSIKLQEELDLVNEKKRELQDEIYNLKADLKIVEKEKEELSSDYKFEVKKLTQDQELAIDRQKVECDISKKKETLNLDKKIQEKDIDLAKSTVKIELYEKMMATEESVLDIKELITTLVNKMPEFKLTDLTVNVGDSDKKRK